jgi:hypothetical protein
MTEEELRAKLKDLGIGTDSWKETAGGEVHSPMLDRHKKLLLKVKDLLEHQIDQDQKEIARLHEMKERLLKGGGI